MVQVRFGNGFLRGCGSKSTRGNPKGPLTGMELTGMERIIKAGPGPALSSGPGDWVEVKDSVEG